MTPLDLKELYARELDNLHKEISAYTDESKLWALSGEIKNTPGNLCLHLLGNVNHFIGAIIGKNGYVRKREEEFTAKNISKEKLLNDITAAKAMVEKVLSGADTAEMQKDFPAELFGKRSTEYMLSYFLGHFMYHLGQINYHRRLV
ncbi:MAG TPA: DinB family protein [Chitinophagales bacterium]|nr:DinB family protein [Chitinophagales bacterium]